MFQCSGHRDPSTRPFEIDFIHTKSYGFVPAFLVIPHLWTYQSHITCRNNWTIMNLRNILGKLQPTATISSVNATCSGWVLPTCSLSMIYRRLSHTTFLKHRAPVPLPPPLSPKSSWSRNWGFHTHALAHQENDVQKRAGEAEVMTYVCDCL